MELASFIHRVGGIASTATLRSAGKRERELTAAVRAGDLVRVRNGWYTTLPADHPRVIAVQVGGRLTGGSALWEMGAWMLDPPSPIRVAIPAHAARPRRIAGVEIHWERAHQPPSAPGVVGLSEALIRVALDEPVDVSVPCFDWALAQQRVDRIDYERILLALPLGARSLNDWVDPASQSVLESAARVRLMRRGWRVRSQVRVGDVGAIDLVIEDHIALELDGRTFHEGTFEADRRKDLAIAAEGRHSLRVSMSMLRHSWPVIEAAIETALAARRLGDAGNSGRSLREPRGRQHSPRHPSLLTGVPHPGGGIPGQPAGIPGLPAS